jgi:hypothetical protein
MIRADKPEVRMHRSASAAFVLALISLAPSACVTKPTYVIDSQATPRGTVSDTAIAVVDKRPADDRESSAGSLLVTSSSYGVHTLGDERFVPAPLTTLSQRLQRATAAWPTRPQSLTLTVDRLNIQNNAQAAMRHSAITSAGLTSLGMDVGEAILGKMREQNIDMRKPFVLCYVEANVDIRWKDRRNESRKFSVIKAQNYDEMATQDQIGKTIAATVSSALDATTAAAKAK